MRRPSVAPAWSCETEIPYIRSAANRQVPSALSLLKCAQSNAKAEREGDQPRGAPRLRNEPQEAAAAGCGSAGLLKRIAAVGIFLQTGHASLIERRNTCGFSPSPRDTRGATATRCACSTPAATPLANKLLDLCDRVRHICTWLFCSIRTPWFTSSPFNLTWKTTLSDEYLNN